MHGRNGREYRLPELPHISVDGYCPETRTICEFFGRHFYGQTCQPFRDVTNMIDGQLAERYARNISRLEQITRAGYLVNVQWECEFHDAGRLELFAHPIVQQIPLCTRDALYGSN